VNVDAGQIQQVINNLLLNADQSMKSGGNIKIEIHTEFINQEISSLDLNSGNYVIISISDHGKGIPFEIKDKIFTPYFTTKKNGTGLGLATAFSIMKKHKGKILFSTKLNEGTTFKIYLLSTDKPKIDRIGSTEIHLTKKGRILILEDDPTVQRFVMKMLTQLGMEVKIEDDGSKIIDAYLESLTKDQPFDLIIMDLTIPGGLGGKETIKKIKEINPAVKAIVSSGYSTDPIMAKYQDFGFVGVLKKPYLINDMKFLLEKWID
jgi:CheY-like chemotaxis protein